MRQTFLSVNVVKDSEKLRVSRPQANQTSNLIVVCRFIVGRQFNQLLTDG